MGMEVSAEIMDGQKIAGVEELFNNKLMQVKQLQKVKDSMKMLSMQAPDMVFIAKNGQSVQCHKSLLGLFSTSLTGIINTVPGWLDTVVILPESSFHTVSYIVGVLYSNTDQEATKDIDVKDVEVTAQLMGVKIPKFTRAEEQIEEVATLSESVMEESFDDGLKNVEIGHELGLNITTPSGDKSKEEEKSNELSILQMLREEVRKVLPKSPMKKLKKMPSTSIELMDCSSKGGFVKAVEVGEEAILEPSSNYKVTLKPMPDNKSTVEPTIDNKTTVEFTNNKAMVEPTTTDNKITEEPTSENKAIEAASALKCDVRIGNDKTGKSYTLSWIPDEDIEMMADNFVEKAVTCTPLPRPKKLLGNKKKDSGARKESNIIMNIAKLKVERQEPSSSDQMIDRIPTISDADIGNPVKKPRISLVSMSKLIESPDVGVDPLEFNLTPNISIADLDIACEQARFKSKVKIGTEQLQVVGRDTKAASASTTGNTGDIIDQSKVVLSESLNYKTKEQSQDGEDNLSKKRKLDDPESKITHESGPTFDPEQNSNKENEVEPDQNLDKKKAVDPDQNLNKEKEVDPDQNLNKEKEVDPDQNLNKEKEVDPNVNLNKEKEVDPNQNVDKQQEVDHDQNLNKDKEVETAKTDSELADEALQQPKNNNTNMKAEFLDAIDDAAIYFDETSSDHLNASFGINLDNTITDGNPLEQANPLSPTPEPSVAEQVTTVDIASKSVEKLPIPATKFEFPKVANVLPSVQIKEEPLDQEPESDQITRLSPIAFIKTETPTPSKASDTPPDAPVILKLKNIHCDLCLESFSLKLDLAKHYSKAHFKAELTAAFSEYFTDGDFCTQCKVNVNESKEDKLEHVGQKHKKVFFLMKEKGLDVIELFRENRVRKFKPASVATIIAAKSTPKSLGSTGKPPKHVPSLGNLTDFPVGCEKCTLRFSSNPQLLKHYSSVHFFTQLKAKIPSFFVKARCKLCGHSLLGEKDKVAHIGFKHDKVNELLKRSGIKVVSSTGLKSLPLLPTSKAPVILHGTTKIIFEANRPVTNTDVIKRKQEGPSGAKYFKLSSSVHCKMVEEKVEISKPKAQDQNIAPVSLPERKKIKITHKPQDDSNFENRENIPLMENESKNEDIIPMDEDESIAKALAESLNTFEDETKEEEKPEDGNKEGNESKSESETHENKAETQQSDQDDSYTTNKRNARNANEPRNFRCSICPKRYTNNPHLNDHYTGYHYKDELCKKYGNEDGTLTCIFCGKVSSNKVKYAMHVGNVHQKLQDYGIKFKNKPKEFRNSVGSGSVGKS